MASINHQEDDRANSSEEDDQPEQENSKDHVGTGGRSYECMFCKRGFTNAQALGGHMNIHRKDRAKNIARPTTKYNVETNYVGPASGPKIYQPVFSSYPHHCLVAHEPQIHYHTYFPCTSSHVTRASNYDRNTYPLEQNQHRVISPCGEDLRLGLSLQLGSRYGEDGLDLELRLGHHP